MVLMHGGHLTGAVYESTPDGREGWLQFFVRKGWPVYCPGTIWLLLQPLLSRICGTSNFLWKKKVVRPTYLHLAQMKKVSYTLNNLIGRWRGKREVRLPTTWGFCGRSNTCYKGKSCIKVFGLMFNSSFFNEGGSY